jgi:hypothetical protein
VLEVPTVLASEVVEATATPALETDVEAFAVD